MKFDEEYFNIGYVDRLSFKNTFIHNIDARAKVFVIFLYVITVVSLPKYEITSMFPFFLFPVLFLTLGDIPTSFVIKRVIIVSPFVFFIGIFNPLLDRQIATTVLGVHISYGWISFFSIFFRFLLTISILVLLVATTSFSGVCYALKKFKVPELFINQLLFVYRYIFVLIEEAMRMVRAKEMRSFGKRGTEIKYYATLIGNLLFRTIERAERIYYAMLSRGYNGSMPYKKRGSMHAKDYLFVTVSLFLLYIFRFHNIIGLVENFIKGIGLK